MRKIVTRRSLRLLQLGFVVAATLALAACDKCAMPVWRHDTPGAPQSCQDEAPPK
jgi:hypothetical protein